MSNVFIFDWDDTILPNSYLLIKYKNILSIPRELIYNSKEFIDAENIIYELFEKTIKLGSVIIITNSEYGWVQLSCQKFFPKVVPLLENILIISSRDRWEITFPNLYYLWKWNSFFELFFNFPYKNIHIISIGDSNIEKNCTQKICSINNYTYKTLKLNERPNLELYVIQLKKCIEFIDKKKECRLVEDYVFMDGEFLPETSLQFSLQL